MRLGRLPALTVVMLLALAIAAAVATGVDRARSTRAADAELAVQRSTWPGLDAAVPQADRVASLTGQALQRDRLHSGPPLPRRVAEPRSLRRGASPWSPARSAHQASRGRGWRIETQSGHRRSRALPHAHVAEGAAARPNERSLIPPAPRVDVPAIPAPPEIVAPTPPVPPQEPLPDGGRSDKPPKDHEEGHPGDED